MGATPFPSTLYARISPDDYQAEPVSSVTIQKAADLPSELRILHGDAWACSFKLVTRTAAERTTLRNFYAARHGSWDSFPFTAPDDSSVRQVRFEGFAGKKLGPTVWEYQIALVQVVA